MGPEPGVGHAEVGPDWPCPRDSRPGLEEARPMPQGGAGWQSGTLSFGLRGSVGAQVGPVEVATEKPSTINASRSSELL